MTLHLLAEGSRRPPIGEACRGASLLRLDRQQALRFIHERRILFDAAGRDNPFAGSDWLLHFIAQVAEDDWTFLVPASRGEGESAMLLYCRRGAPYRCLSVSNWYASLYSPLVSSAADRGAALDGLVDGLVARHPGCAAVQLVPLDRDALETAVLERAFARHSWYVKRYFGFGNWHLRCPGLSFADYMAGRDSRLRHTWSRKARKFQGSGAEGRLEIVTDSARVEAAMDAYEQVYARSWKEPEAYPGFVRGWARICARNGWLRLGLAWVGEVPVAAQFWFTLHGRANVFKLAYDERYSRYSAGTVLTAHLFRHALDEDRVAEIDYLSGDDPYKRDWMDERRERIGLFACNPRTLRGLLLAAGDLAGDITRPWRRWIRPRGETAAPGRP